jgi:hypothetical protein
MRLQEYQVFVGLCFDGKSVADLTEEMSVSTQYVYTLRLRYISRLKDHYGASTFDSAERA